MHNLTPKALEILNANADILRAAGNFRATVEGYADESGAEEQNKWLGLWRAKVVKDRLRDLGLSPEKLQLNSMGGARPDQAGRENNRRVEIIVLRLP